MPTFLYRCPITAFNVQGWVANDPTEDEAERFVPVTCLICSRLHLVNPKAGKVAGEGEK